jgi:hypothetical protein
VTYKNRKVLTVLTATSVYPVLRPPQGSFSVPFPFWKRPINGAVLLMIILWLSQQMLYARSKIINPYPKPACTDHTPKFCGPSPTMMMSQYEGILSNSRLDVKQATHLLRPEAASTYPPTGTQDSISVPANWDPRQH